MVKREGLLVLVNEQWYPIGQVIELMADAFDDEDRKAMLTADEETMAGILRRLGFRTAINIPKMEAF